MPEPKIVKRVSPLAAAIKEPVCGVAPNVDQVDALDPSLLNMNERSETGAVKAMSRVDAVGYPL